MADDILDPVGFESEVPPKPMAKRLETLSGKTAQRPVRCGRFRSARQAESGPYRRRRSAKGVARGLRRNCGRDQQLRVVYVVQFARHRIF